VTTIGWIAESDALTRALVWVVFYLLWMANLASVMRHPDTMWHHAGRSRGFWLTIVLLAGCASFAALGLTFVIHLAYVLGPARALRQAYRQTPS